jgi:hypothetical protein
VAGLLDVFDDGEDNLQRLILRAEVEKPCPEHILCSIASGSRSLLIEEVGVLPSTLLPVYHARFDSVHKILHWPSFTASIEELSFENNSSLAVLKNVVCFAPVCTIADHENDNFLPSGRDIHMKHYRTVTEQGLAENGLLKKPDLMLLQPFTIYLVRPSPSHYCAVLSATNSKSQY